MLSPGHADAIAKRASIGMISEPARDRLLAVACAVVLCLILVAGLWPFNPLPKNNVEWSRDGSGLHLAGRGQAVSSAPLPPPGPQGAHACSLELWARANLPKGVSTLLGFYMPGNPTAFFIRQYSSGAVFEQGDESAFGLHRRRYMYIDRVFDSQAPAFLALTASAQSNSAYVNGVLKEKSTRLGFPCGNLSGWLVVGNSPVENDSWRGWVRGLAVFDRELTADEVLAHYRSWAGSGRLDASAGPGLAALYLFDEGSGSTIHNRAGRAPDLMIPDHYRLLHASFLKVPWREFQATWGYLWDLIVNIAGFIPFGFVFCAYLRLARQSARALGLTICLGFAASLTIEVLQAYLPTRGSGMTDLITNTLGTTLGAALVGAKITPAAFRVLGLPFER
jgi:hypothetical protein